MLGKLPQLGITSYNGYSFPSGETIDTIAYSVTPKYDAARRTVTYCVFDVGMRWYVADDQDTTDQIEDMIARLGRPGGQLTYDGRGFGNETVNTGVVRDVDWGPRPGPVKLLPVGAGLTTRVEWSVSFSIPTCADAVYTGVLEWNFGVAYALDGDGVTTRTTSGHVTIANNRLAPGDRSVPRSADAFRSAVVPGLLRGFKRESQTFTLSLDKNKLDYTIEDRELGGNTPGPGLTSAEATESVTNPDPKNYFRWLKTIQGTYTVAAGYDVGAAWDAFFKTVRHRQNDSYTRIVPRPLLMPVNFTSTDPAIYAPRQKVQLSFSYYIVIATLVQALKASGQWQSVPNSTYREWSTKIGSAFTPRSSADLRFDVGDDALIDLCGYKAVPPSSTTSTPTTSTPSSNPQHSPLFSAVIGAGRGIASGAAGDLIANLFPPPTKDSSWLAYEVYTKIVTDTGAVLVKTLPPAPLVRAQNGQTSWDVALNKLPTTDDRTFPAVVAPSSGQSASSQPPDDTAIQYRTTPTVHVYLSGRAVRYGFDIPHPQLLSVNNLPATLMPAVGDEGFSSGVVGNSIYPIFGAHWNLHYVVPGLSRMSSPPNPLRVPT